MRINPIGYTPPLKYTSFQGNKRCNVPVFDDDTFKISMKYYEDNYYALLKMNKLALDISNLIKADVDFDTILNTIEQGIKEVNYNMWYFGEKRKTKSPFAIAEDRRGEEYYETYMKKIQNCRCKPKSNDKYKNANTCEITYGRYPSEHAEIDYGWKKLCKSNLNYVKEEYNHLKSIDNPTLDDINRSCATIQWLILQECPYSRGNDSIANILTKAIYNSYGIKVSAPKVGQSFDFEGFYRDLDEYIKIYPDIFKIPPYEY